MKNKNIPDMRFKGFSDEWEQRKIGEFYDFKNGLNKEKEYFGYGIPIVNFMDVFHNRGIYASQLKGKVDLEYSEIANYRVRQGDIFFTRTSETIDEIGYPSVMLDNAENTVFSGFVLRGRAKNEDPLTLNFKKYIFFTKAFRHEMIMKSSMTTRALTSGTVIKKMYIKFPKNKEEQNRIGEFFTNIDNNITLNQCKYDKLVNLKKAMLEKMFPKDGADVPEIRFKGFTGAWEKRKLGDLVNFVVDNRGKNPKYYCDRGIPVIDNFMIKNNYYPNLNEATRFIDDNLFDNFIRKYNDVDDVLITLVGNGIGNITLFPNKKSVIIQNTLGLRFDNNKVFKFYSLLSKNKQIKALDRGMAQPSIRQDELLDIYLEVPSESEQDKIAMYFKNIDTLINLHKNKIEKLKNIKKACLEKMFV